MLGKFAGRSVLLYSCGNHLQVVFSHGQHILDPGAAMVHGPSLGHLIVRKVVYVVFY